MPVVALVDLVFYALIFFTLAFAFASRKMTQAILGGLISALQSIPVIGGKLASPLQAAERAIVGACSSLEQGCDHLLGASWHMTARLLNWTWREIRSHAGAIAAIAGPVGSILTLVHGIRALIHRLTRIAHASTAGVKRLEKEYHGIEHRLKAFEHDIRHGIGHDVLPRIRSLDKELAHVEHKVIPGIRSDVAATENEVTALGKWVRNHALVAGTSVFAGAVAWALSNLGLGWLRCNSNPFNNNRNACGLWGDLAALLGLATAVLAAEDFEQLIREMQAVEGAVIGAAEDLFNLG